MSETQETALERRLAGLRQHMARRILAEAGVNGTPIAPTAELVALDTALDLVRCWRAYLATVDSLERASIVAEARTLLARGDAS